MSGDQFWVHELVPKPIQDLGFQLVPPHREPVVTCAFVSGGGASVVELTDFRAPASAGPAFEEAGERVARSRARSERMPLSFVMTRDRERPSGAL